MFRSGCMSARQRDQNVHRGRDPEARGIGATLVGRSGLQLGEIAERAGGESLGALYDRLVFNPAGMEAAVIPFQQASADVDLAGGIDVDYLPFGKHYMEPDDTSWASLAGASGGGATTAREMVCFLRSLFWGDLVRPATLDRMTMFDNTPDGEPQENVTGYGLGVARFSLDSGTWYGHGGAVMGWETLALYRPEPRIAVSVIINKTQRENDIFRIFDELSPYFR